MKKIIYDLLVSISTAATSGTDSELETTSYASESTTEQTSFGLTYTTYTACT